MARAPQNFFEQVAMEVSARSRRAGSGTQPEWILDYGVPPLRALQLLRDSRLAYEGLLYELEENHQPRAPDWVAADGNEVGSGLPRFLSSSPDKAHAQLPHARVFLEGDCAARRNHSRASKNQGFTTAFRKAYETLLENQAKRRKCKDPE